MALMRNDRRFLLKKLFTGVKDLQNVYVKNTFSTTLFNLGKHYSPKFKWLRSKKVIPIDLPDFQRELTVEEIRSRLKELGILPPRYWRERPITILSTNNIFDAYKPLKGDGKTSFLRQPTKSIVDYTKTKKSDILAIKKIKSFEPDFDSKTFPQHAHDIYVKAHTVLMNKDPEALSEFVTEAANKEMMDGLKYKTLRWKFVESLEPPVLIQARYDSIISETNIFAQITVRFHTKQTLAIYDRFGRLLYGHEEIPKDVLEYIVFEKHIVNEYGKWRLHGKIIPEWQTPIDSSSRTYRVTKVNEEEEEEEEEEIMKMKNKF